MTEFKIDTTVIKSPLTTSYAVSRNDIDSADSGRSDNGYMYRDVVRTGTYKISAAWRLSGAECLALETLLSSANFTFAFDYLGVSVTRTMYCSTRNIAVLSVYGQGLYELSAEIVEV